MKEWLAIVVCAIMIMLLGNASAGMTPGQGAARMPGIETDERGRPTAIEPFLRVLPMGPLDIDGLGTSVIMIFSTNCENSRQIHSRAAIWAQTLPEGWRFMPMHVVGPGYTAPGPVALAARAAAQAGAGEFWEHDYWEMMYEAVQSGELDMEDIAGAVRVASAAGVDDQALWDKLVGPDVIEASQTMGDVLIRYQPDRVPTFIVGDRYMTHPDLVGQNPLDALRVVNALVAKIIGEKKE